MRMTARFPVLAMLVCFMASAARAATPGGTAAVATAAHGAGAWTLAAWSIPFVAILLAIALFPLVPGLRHYWDRNRVKLLFSILLGLVVCLYYLYRPAPFKEAAAGWPSFAQLLHDALIVDYAPFIICSSACSQSAAASA